jgi:hypothetical protein
MSQRELVADTFFPVGTDASGSYAGQTMFADGGKHAAA